MAPSKRAQGEPAASLPPPSEPPEGPAKLLLTKEDGGFSRSNPFALKRTIDALCGPVKDAKALRSGALLVETFTKAQTVAILATTQFGGKPVKAQLADKIALTQGLIRSDALVMMSNQELLDELAALSPGSGCSRASGLRQTRERA